MRRPVVANRFYPGSSEDLIGTIDEMVPEVAASDKQEAIAVVSPHAGYVYSGPVSAETIARVKVPDTVVILGPNHHGRGEPLALGVEDWHMPMGDVPVNKKLASLILERSTVIREDESAQEYEHSLEVQVPFLQYFNNSLEIVPIVVSHVTFAACQEAARDLASAIRDFDKPVLLLASTDMTHYESRRDASRKDRLAIERIEAMDPQGLYETVVGNRISMCGIIPTTIVLLAAIELGATRANLVRYTDSGEASGDTNQVVGYAGLIIQ
jgi:AmmeMemoRadiSam system protein B